MTQGSGSYGTTDDSTSAATEPDDTSTGTTTADTSTGTTTSDPSTSTTTAGTTDTTAGDASTGDASTTAPPMCGDGAVDPGEACDDGNMVDDDTCSNTCKEPVNQLRKIYLSSCNGDVGFYGYDIQGDAWTILPSPPTPTYSQITNDGTFVYLLGADNTIYQYDPGSNAWAPAAITGPDADSAFEAVGYFKWTDHGFYYLLDGGQLLHHHKDNAWTTIQLAVPAASAGSWDRANNELYLRTWKQLGFQVLSTTNDTVVRTIVDPTAVDENSRTGSLSGGFFYDRTFTGSLQKLDRNTGAKTDTGKTPMANHTASDTDLTSGLVYLGGYEDLGTLFQRYDPVDNTLIMLADSPAVPNHSTITVMLPN